MTKTLPRRPRGPVTAAALLAGAVALAWPGTAVAVDAPGNNGTVKIQDADDPDKNSDNANDPRVCNFFIAAMNFDDEPAELTYQIKEGPPFPNNPSPPFAAEGTISIEDGEGQTDLIPLDDGKYKLFVDGQGIKQNEKQKVFTVDCPDDPEMPPNGEEPPPGEEEPPPGEEEPPPGGEEPLPDGEEPPGEDEDKDKDDDKKDKKKKDRDRDEDRDDGPAAEGGVNTGGGASASSTGAAALGLLLAGAAGSAVAVRTRRAGTR